MAGQHPRKATETYKCSASQNMLLLLLLPLQSWRQTLWSDISTSEMGEGAKQFVKEVKSLSKKVGCSGVCV